MAPGSGVPRVPRVHKDRLTTGAQGHLRAQAGDFDGVKPGSDVVDLVGCGVLVYQFMMSM